MTVNSNYPHSAISSYSGFIYQGKVAVLHCVSLFAKTNIDQLADYQLQMDSLDDFAILEGSIIHSLHQVKAKRDSNFQSYKGDFVNQKRKLNEDGALSAFFHVSVDLTGVPANFNTEYPNTEIYQYDHYDGSQKGSCGLGDINKCIELQIKKAYQRLGGGWVKT